MEIEERVCSVNKNAGKLRQVLATVMANIYTLTAVMVVVMLVSAYNQFGTSRRDNILLVMLSPVPIMLGFPIAHYSCETYGRKFTLCLSTIPLTICCALLPIIGESKVLLSFAFFGGGLGSSMCLFAVPLYVSEISCDSMRGVLGSIRPIFITCGLASGYFIADERNFRDSAYIIMFLPLLVVFSFIYAPESPIYLYRKSELNNTIKSLMWLRMNDQQCVNQELSGLKASVQLTPINNVHLLLTFFRSAENARGFVVACGLLSAQSAWLITTTLHVGMHMYDTIREDQVRGSLMTIFLVSLILGSVAPLLMVNCVGRRKLLLISCIGSTFYFAAYVVITLLPYSVHVTGWVPMSLGILAIISYYLGIGTLPSIIATEVFRFEILSFGYAYSTFISWVVLHLLLVMEGLASIGLQGTALINMVLCIVNFSFILFFVPETKGKNIGSIVSELRTGYRK